MATVTLSPSLFTQTHMILTTLNVYSKSATTQIAKGSKVASLNYEVTANSSLNQVNSLNDVQI